MNRADGFDMLTSSVGTIRIVTSVSKKIFKLLTIK